MSYKNHILVVDDNLINRQYFTMVLNKYGYQTSVVDNGYDAIDMAKETDFDLVLMDIRMPELNGYETTKRIRYIPQHLKTPIIAISAETITSIESNIFDDFFLKPIKPKELLNLINKHLVSEDNSFEIFNQTTALEYAYGDKNIMQQLLTLFVKELPTQVDLIRSSLILHKHATCLEHIHKVRGSCKACGAEVLDQHLQKLKLAIDHLNSDQIKNSIESVEVAMRDYLSKI